MKHLKHLLSAALLFVLLLLSSTPTFADSCSSVGQCVNGRTCIRVEVDPRIFQILPEGDACGAGVGQEVIGTVRAPLSIQIFNLNYGSGENIGILVFINRVILFITIVAGLFVMFNFIKAGWMFLTAGDNTKVTGEVKDVLTYSVIGLVIIAVTYTIAGLIGLIFFGDASFILNPQLQSAISP